MHNCPDEDRAHPDNEVEVWARDDLQRHMDAQLLIWDDKSEDRMWDFCVVGDGSTHLASLEVTRSTDQALKEFYIHLNKAGDVWDAPHGLQSCWTVLLKKDVNPLKLNRGRLAELLLAGQDGSEEQLTPYSAKPVRDMVNELALEAAFRRHLCPEGPGIHIQPMGQFWTGGHQVTRSLISEAKANEEKLLDAPKPRHLLIWIEIENMAATFGIAEDPPDELIELPDFIDVGWAAAGAGDPENTALWRVAKGEPWEVIQPFPNRSVDEDR